MLTRITDPQEESLETSLEKYCAIRVVLQNTSKVIEQLNEAFPLENIRHLKRIRKLKEQEYVTALVSKIDSDDSCLEIKMKLDELKIPFIEVVSVNVPIRQPMTKKQYESWNSIWPLVFHESMDEKLKLKQLLEHTELFKQYYDYFCKNNISAMIIESANLLQFSEENIIYECFSSMMSCEEPRTGYPFDHVVLNCLSNYQKNIRIIRDGKIPYLLSGCIAILVNEPCTMCSMALLHSRIDAVIFCRKNNIAGALGSKCYLHSMESLNHRFPVYFADFSIQDN